MPDYKTASPAILEDHARSLVNLVAEEVGWAYRAGENFPVRVKDVRSYNGKAKRHIAQGPVWLHLAERIWRDPSDGWEDYWVHVVLHETAHLMVPEGGHGAKFQAKCSHLHHLWGWNVEWKQTPGYEDRILDEDGEDLWVNPKFRRNSYTPSYDFSMIDVTKIEAGDYRVTAQDGTTYRVYRPTWDHGWSRQQAEFWLVRREVEGADPVRETMRLRDAKRWIKHNHSEEGVA